MYAGKRKASRVAAATAAVSAALCVAAAFPAKAALIPPGEWAMIRQVAVNYDLSDEDTWLLAAIRRHENGRPGLEFGVGGPMDSGHRAHRYRDGVKSFYVQAAWAAGTIRRHYRGDLAAFGRRYNPPHPEKWSAGVRSLITRLKNENGGRLPGPRPRKKELKFP
jgi:hypothetical protein